MFYVTDRAKPSHHFSFPTVMLDTLITSKTRIKLLMKFFLNANTNAYLRGLESEFGESTNAIRLELNRFEQAGLLISRIEGNRKVFSANHSHPLFQAIQELVRKHIGIDQLVEHLIGNEGAVEKVYLMGECALGHDSPDIDILLVVGSSVDAGYLEGLISKASWMIKKKIRYSLMPKVKFREYLDQLEDKNLLLLWEIKD
jgi:hypothetical protein